MGFNRVIYFSTWRSTPNGNLNTSDRVNYLLSALTLCLFESICNLTKFPPSTRHKTAIRAGENFFLSENIDLESKIFCKLKLSTQKITISLAGIQPIAINFSDSSKFVMSYLTHTLS